MALSTDETEQTNTHVVAKPQVYINAAGSTFTLRMTTELLSTRIGGMLEKLQLIAQEPGYRIGHRKSGN